MSRPLSFSFETHRNYVADTPEGEQWNQECPTKLGGSASVAPFSMHGAVNRLVSFFLAGHDMCVLVSQKESGTLTGDSLESPMRLRNELHYSGSLLGSHLSNAEQEKTILSNEKCNLLGCPFPFSMSTEISHGMDRNSSPDKASLSTPSLNQLVPMARTGGGAAVVGMFACFCQAALEQIPHLRIFVSFVEREGNHWLDLIYQISVPTSSPLRLRRHAVQEVSCLSHAFFHCVSSVRDMLDLTYKAMQNCPQRNDNVQKEDSLVIQLIGVPCNVEVQGGEEMQVTSWGARAIVFTQPAVCSALSEEWGIHFSACVPSTSCDGRVPMFDLPEVGMEVQQVLRAVEGVMPTSIAVRHLPGAIKALLPQLPEGICVKDSVTHAVEGQDSLLPHLQQRRRERQGTDDVENQVIINEEVGLNVNTLANTNSAEITEQVEATYFLQLSNVFSRTSLARRALRCIPLPNKMNDYKVNSYWSVRRPSDPKSSLSAPILGKGSPLAPIAARRGSNLLRSERFLITSSSAEEVRNAIKTHERQRNSTSNCRLMRREPLLPVVYMQKRLYWQRESVRALELKERNMIELDEKRRRRIAEVKIEQMKRGSRFGAHSLRKYFFLLREKQKATSLFSLPPFS
ncbi:hypothetical protein MOQ_000704 [Trypanosoma cruzi marinkellei]|uniref:Uncharacterized protein n=1 Tax=Trypanosoma cruzi marinkellei TaxID=85056 RepID=K2MV46_TRYCR|nr:hypothetical protein MOQ_000704 [Trypanosoma cruzi marinkellei]